MQLMDAITVSISSNVLLANAGEQNYGELCLFPTLLIDCQLW